VERNGESIMVTNNFEFMEMVKVIAINLKAKSVSLIDDKKYRFYISSERMVDIPKTKIELEFLRTVKIDVMQ
jgi:hypothetical protein